jgi:hypothetical protein
VQLWEFEIDLRQFLFQNVCHPLFEAICRLVTSFFKLLLAKSHEANHSKIWVNIGAYKFDFEIA